MVVAPDIAAYGVTVHNVNIGVGIGSRKGDAGDHRYHGGRYKMYFSLLRDR